MNKFTRFIDEMFAKYDPDGKAIKIYIGYCHQGDEDGGCDCYDYVCGGYWFERGRLPKKLRSDELFIVFDEQNSFEYSEDDYAKDWEALCHMISKSFGQAVKPNYESTNCYYYRYYIVTRDYKICSFVCRSDLDDCNLRELADMSKLSEEAAEHAEDQQRLTQIKALANQIHSVFSSIEDESFKEKARQLVADSTK